MIWTLKDKISILHYFHLVHLDIKPPNIMFSPSIEDFVYIDYGFSKLIKENIGFKSKSKYYGSIKYCGE